ncbi:hypothetical protein CDL12_27275 [Handroanthus impetiginosus]|uniref:Uncharacterized protein n=1 Tax=Handroanthus impetiginosus TaxID=429701 RepID=A0A2G9G4V0_9LAMI|nr:hypothetical protein CDL12_27275 [Handroanthus impetiginosus]
MESSLTKLEMDAVFQLIQLSGTSEDDLPLFWVNFPAEREGKTNEEEEEGGSASEAQSSSLINEEKKWSEEALPRRKIKYGSLVEIYKKTQPLISNNRPSKRPRF